MTTKYSRKYRKEWEKFPELKNWLKGEGDSAQCKVCNTNLQPHLADLKKHAKGKKHLELMRAVILQPSVSSTLKNYEDLPISKKKRLEIRVALQTAVCSTFRSVDSLGSILEDELGKNGFQVKLFG